MTDASRSLAARVRSPAGGATSGTCAAEELGIDVPRYGKNFAALLGVLKAYSPFLWRLCRFDVERLGRLAAGDPDETLTEILTRQMAVGHEFRACTIAADEASATLRRNRAEVALLVALADLGGIWTFEEVTSALSRFADASVQSAVAVALTEAEKAGRLHPSASDGKGCGLVVLALGKHGAGELNYSSDIDLVLFFDPDASALAGQGTGAATYTRIGQRIAKLLGERTANGYVHRVDYRLRPDPGSTPTAVSLPAAYTCYESVGQNWERAALIKARAVAGDVTLGERFLEDLQPFIWRKYFDYNSIADIHAMKRQIHAVRGHDAIAVGGHDIKLGRGGIREIEFFVQTQQLVFGGRRPALRGRRTLDMLAELAAEGWISVDACDDLGTSYRFLRTIEHRLQMVSDEQTQRLPTLPDELDAFARFAGFEGEPEFAARLRSEAGCVQRHYGRLFEAGGELVSDLGNLVFTGSEDDPQTLVTLRQIGFLEPERAAETVRGWHFGRRPAIASSRAREVLTELVPSLLAALGETSDPDAALARLDAALGRMPAAAELLTILRRNSQLRTLFADLLGTAPRLAEAVAGSPHVLDAIIDPAFVHPPADQDAIDAETASLIGAASSTEDFLDRIRDVARQMQFVTGARLLSGILSPKAAGVQYAGIATAILRACLAWVTREFECEHGHVAKGSLAIVGLGRLGAADLTASSDLDLLVVYGFDPAQRDSNGGRPLDAVVYYTRLTQRLIAALTVPTRRGKLYEIDLRLRPSGRKGPVATQFAGIASYYANEAETWEQMALSRARVIAGHPLLGCELGRTVQTILCTKRDRSRVFADCVAMRDLVEAERRPSDVWDVKLAPGGLMDIDFLAQALLLAHASSCPALIQSSSTSVVRAASDYDLVSHADASELADAYDILDGIAHRQRLILGSSIETDRTRTESRERLAVMCGSPSAAHLTEQLAQVRAGVRGIFDRILRHQAG